MAIGPFLTELDGRAIIKGSRDPLGVQQIWTRLGRRVIGNLTTVSNSLRDFTTLMIGLYLADALGEAGQKNAGLPAFLRWEQLAGYARGHVNLDWGFRGTERVKANLVSSNTQTLSVKGKGPILSDQKTYGLWGLYTVPARLSGLVDADVSRLTPVARDFVERHYVPKLSLQGQGLKPLLALIQNDPAAIRVDHPLVAAVGNALSQKKLSKAEIAFYREYLIEGGPNDATHGIQTLLERAMTDTLPRNDFRWGPEEVRQITQRADKLGEQGQDLAQRLQQILDCEAVIAPISRLFTHLLAKHGVQVDEVAAQIRQAWGKGATTIDAEAFSALRPYLPTTELGSADHWIRIASLAETGDYAALVTEMVAMNRSVMAARGGAAWVQISDGALQVSFQEEQGRMPAGEELRTQWRHPYFLDSLRAMAIPLRER